MSRTEDLFIRQGHFAFHFRPVLLRMINSGRRPVAPFPRALFSTEMPETRPVEKSQAKFIPTRCCARGMRTSLYECQRILARSSKSLRSLAENPRPRSIASSTPIVVSAGSATDSYEFVWHPSAE